MGYIRTLLAVGWFTVDQVAAYLLPPIRRRWDVTTCPVKSSEDDDTTGSSLVRSAVLSSASGSWAGYETTFSAITGNPIPLTNYVSDDLLEWGQVILHPTKETM